MNSTTVKHLKTCGRVAALALLTGLVLSASAPAGAFAASPHVRATVQTSTCAVCHTVHVASDTSALLLAEGTATGVSRSCLACHDGTDSTASNVASGPTDSFGLPSGHSLATTSPGTAPMNGCPTCHAVHGASSDARMVPAKQVNGTAVSSARSELCLACHDSSAAWFGPGYPSTSAPARDATGYPVAGTWPGSAAYRAASNAHRLIPESTRTVSSSEPVLREQGDCLYCHGAHGGANDYDGLLTTYTVPSAATLASDVADGSYAALCFTCHGGTRPSGFATTPVDIKRFATAGGKGGHSIVTTGGTLPVGAPLPCFECHNPHGSRGGNGSLITDERGASLGTTDAAGVRSFCFTCHTTSDTTAGWDSGTAAFAAVAPAEKVVGLPRDGAALHLPAGGGHNEADAASCYECHGNSYAAGGRNVHDPASGTVSGLAPASVPEFSTVPSAAADASAALDATVGATLDATASVGVTDPAGALPMPALPVLPSDLSTGFGWTGTPDATEAPPAP